MPAITINGKGYTITDAEYAAAKAAGGFVAHNPNGTVMGTFNLNASTNVAVAAAPPAAAPAAAAPAAPAAPAAAAPAAPQLAAGDPPPAAAPPAAPPAAATDDAKLRSDLFDENGMPRLGTINGKSAANDPRFDDSILGKDVEGETPRSTQGLSSKLTAEQKAASSIDNLIKYVNLPAGATYAEKLMVASLLQRAAIEGFAMGIDIPAQFKPGGKMEQGINLSGFNPTGGTGGHFGSDGSGELHGKSFDINNGDDGIQYTTFTHEFTGHGALARPHTSDPSSIMLSNGDIGVIPSLTGNSNSPLPDWEEHMKETYNPKNWGADLPKSAPGPLFPATPDHSKETGLPAKDPAPAPTGDPFPTSVKNPTVSTGGPTTTNGPNQFPVSTGGPPMSNGPIIGPGPMDASPMMVQPLQPMAPWGPSMSASGAGSYVGDSDGQEGGFDPVQMGMASLDRRSSSSRVSARGPDSGLPPPRERGDADQGNAFRNDLAERLKSRGAIPKVSDAGGGNLSRRQ